MNTTDETPADAYTAADWLLRRHEWARELVARVLLLGRENSNELPEDVPGWLDQLGEAVAGAATDAAAWAVYEARNPAPHDTHEYDRWHDAGPKTTPEVEAFQVMSGGEKRLVRLIATLCPRTRAPWAMDDLGGWDERGAAVLADWLAIVRRQMPEHMYPAGPNPAEAGRMLRAVVGDGDAGDLRLIEILNRAGEPPTPEAVDWVANVVRDLRRIAAEEHAERTAKA